MVAAQDNVTSFDPPVVSSVTALSAPWAEEDGELFGCLFKSDDVGSVRTQCPVVSSSLQSVETVTARSKGPELASFLPSFETIETEADASHLSSAVNDELRAAIRRLETKKNDGRTADGAGRPSTGDGQRRRRQIKCDRQKVTAHHLVRTRKPIVQFSSGITVSSDRDVP